MVQSELTTDKIAIALPKEKIIEFCDRWQICELALFGSILREDFRADSDVDVLVTFRDRARITLLDLVKMEQELAEIIGRQVDLVSKRGIENSQNWLRRQEILETARVFYVSE